MTAEKILVNEATIANQELLETFKHRSGEEEAHEERLRLKARKVRMQGYRPAHPGGHCWHCAQTHKMRSLNFEEAGTRVRRGRDNGVPCWKQMQTARHLITAYTRRYADAPNGTNFVAPPWFRGPRVWRKDDKTGVFRPRRMMDDLLDKKKADKQERIARGLEVEEEEEQEEEAEAEDSEVESDEDEDNE
ncbi:hypothetical protein UCRPA7_4661 [Phaeoacremonium minimum UCRPA7]|uniref:Uncharacterized protein n=1 Tax=Phaeoacremonium minimum (strain UCR-PA7) TaxID=1286976 RepID=R8BK56_PHAM7|nr:hypothetical protein UCRPA7_4661 [Phaeoacremonium minimum UCRPA7]EON99738.1 hypothetical protein UCRPA7_4661 [Phaeoacremonium minimum UCRPA7]